MKRNLCEQRNKSLAHGDALSVIFAKRIIIADVPPSSAHPELLLSTAYEFEIYQDGTISFTWNGQFYQGLLSYGVLSGAFVSASSGVEFYQTADVNADGVADFEIVYPNGDRQVVFTIPNS